MPKVTLEIELSDEVMEKARQLGRLTPDALAAMIERAVTDYPDLEKDDDVMPLQYEKWMVGAVSPRLLGRGK